MTNSYSVQSEILGETEIFSLRESDRACAQIVPAWGNNCFVFEAQESILEPVTFEEFSTRPTSFGIPILFPFPNRIREGKFTFRDRQFVVNPNRHGFVRDKPWEVLATGASEQEGAWIKSAIDARQYPESILQQYSFPFRLEVTYGLRNRRLTMATVVQNTGAQEMPCGFGIHPYFCCPSQGTLQVPAHKRWELLDSLPTGNLLAVEGQYDLRQPRAISELALDDIFTDLAPDEDGVVRCVLADRSKNIKTIVEFDAQQFPEVVVYNPPAPRQAICIEPYTCPTDGFNLHQQGIDSHLIVVRPQEEIRFQVCIYAQ